MHTKKRRIGLILGSASDLRLVERCRERLDSLGEPYEMIVASAHRTPDLVKEWTEGAEERGLKAIIAAAGAAAALPGVVAAHTLLPVVGLPLDATPLRGVDSLYAIVQMPPGIPVATVGINNADNAALVALQIVAIGDPELTARLAKFRRALAAKVAKANEELYEEDPSLRPGGPWIQLAEEQEVEPAIEKKPAPPSPARAPHHRKRLKVHPDLPDEATLERAMDALIDGGVVALPTDTVYGLAADASRPQAVAKLFELKGRLAEKSIPLLIPSLRMLDQIAMEIPEEIEGVLEELWPGALTVVFNKYPAAFKSVASGGTIAVRIPDSGVARGLMDMMGRPLAVTSANLSNERPAMDASSIERIFGEKVNLILDAGALPHSAPSTVLDVTSEPFRILREGAIPRSDLTALLGGLLAE